LLSSFSAPIQKRRRRSSWIEYDLVETNSERNSGSCNVQPSSLGFRLGSTLQLGSVVDGNEVSNVFVVTEVYVQQAEGWTLASMSFTRLVTHS
jgi:hypothetical protein